MSTTQYQVLVRNGSSDLFVASVLGMADCVWEGRTREEAIAKARAALVDRLARGEIVTIDVESSEAVSATMVEERSPRVNWNVLPESGPLPV